MSRLQIYDRRERWLVSSADRVLQTAAAIARPFRRRRRPSTPKRILLLRLERIGDLLMALPAIGDVRSFAPAAQIDLVVGSWNVDIARALTAITRFETLDAAWLSRSGGGLGLRPLIAHARGWRRRRYDVAINFEPDVRSNLVTAAAGARWTAGYRSGGGGALLDVALDYDTRAHATDNARRLAAAVFGRAAATEPPAVAAISQWTSETAEELLRGASRPIVGMHVSGGRDVKQWDLDRFADVARRLIARGAAVVLTGSTADRPLVDSVKRMLPSAGVIDVAGDHDLITLASVLDRLDLFVTGDTGPMHLAAAVGTPIVAVFGPSDPVRYAPRGPNDRIVRVDLPCSPCNRIRLPPERCVGHTPDCLTLVSADRVFAEAAALLDSSLRDQSARTAGAPA